MRYITEAFRRRRGVGASPGQMAGAVATPALADYGTGAQYQVEISANNVGGVPGDGVWLWIELNSNGTGDYTGGDCIHTGPTGLNGAAHERGDVTWTDSGGKLTISGVGLVGGQYPVTVVVPNRYGHYTGASGNFVQYPRPDRRHRPSTSRPVPSRTHSGHWKPTVASRMQSGQT